MSKAFQHPTSLDVVADLYNLQRHEILDKLKLIENYAKSNKRRFPKNAKTLKFFSDELELHSSVYFKNSIERMLDKPEVRKSFSLRTNERLKNKNKDQIIAECTDLEVLLLKAVVYFEHYSLSYNRILDHFIDVSVKNSGYATNRGASRNKLHEEDNARLEECLKLFKDKLKRDFVESDLREYIKLVKRTYPTQKYIQKPRLTSEEKSYSIEDQKFVLDKKIKARGKGWSEPRIIRFFNTATGLKGTTL